MGTMKSKITYAFIDVDGPFQLGTALKITNVLDVDPSIANRKSRG